ncbi:hypothetical protein [Granulicella tundricola]|nr:hypothetical protein [Granulicella tundricola]
MADLLDAPRVVVAERTHDGIYLEFEDGKCAVYPAFFLYASYDMARVLSEADLATSPKVRTNA